LGILEDIETKRPYTLGPRCLVGRHASCDLCFPDPRVSGEHAIVRWVDERWEVKDLGSRNGTFVNGRRLMAGERMTLWRGEAVTLGGSTVGFVLADAAAGATDPARLPAASAPALDLLADVHVTREVRLFAS